MFDDEILEPGLAVRRQGVEDIAYVDELRIGARFATAQIVFYDGEVSPVITYRRKWSVHPS